MSPRPPRSSARGILELFEFLRIKGLTQRDLARGVHVSHVTVVRWLSGSARPVILYRHMIERWTRGRVRAASWLSPEEAAAIARVVPYSPGHRARKAALRVAPSRRVCLGDERGDDWNE